MNFKQKEKSYPESVLLCVKADACFNCKDSGLKISSYANNQTKKYVIVLQEVVHHAYHRFD